MTALLAALLLLLSFCPAQAGLLDFGQPVPPDTCHVGCAFNGLGCNPAKPGMYHTGKDYITDVGAVDVLASADGIVAAVFPNEAGHGMGVTLVLRHTLRSGEEVYSLYGHLAHLADGLQVGDEVLKGEPVALMGGSGFGEPTYWNLHVHFEIKEAPIRGDPESDQYEGYTPTPAQNWGYTNPNDYIDKVEFVPLNAEVVSRPQTPSGPAALEATQQGSYTSGGSACNYGHAVQYNFDWGDGQNSGWLTSPAAAHAWAQPGTYTLSVRARCAEHQEVVSAPANLVVQVSRPVPVFEGLPPAQNLKEGHKLELTVQATDPMQEPVTISPEGEWPTDSRFVGGAGGQATVIFWPDYDQGETDGALYHLGLKATAGSATRHAEVTVYVLDVPQVHISGSSIVGEGGGIVTGEGAMVSFPSGALPPSTRATVGTADESLFTSLPEGHFGPVAMLGPPGCQFLAPAEVTLRYEGKDPSGSGPTIYAYDLDTGRWQAIHPAKAPAIDKENNTVTFQAEEAGLYVAATGSASGKGSSGGGCFIATAACGPHSPQVACLRRLRDEVLLTSPLGRRFVRAYYRFSPPAARLLAQEQPLVRQLVRGALWPITWAASVWLKLGAALGWLTLLGLGWLLWRGTTRPSQTFRH